VYLLHTTPRLIAFYLSTFLCPYNCYRLFRRLCILAKSACYCRRVRSYFCPHVPSRIQMEGFPWNLILGTFMEICREDSNLVTVGQKCRALCMKNWVCFVVSGDISSPEVHCYASHCWQWYVAQKCTDGALLHYHCNSGYTDKSQFYFISTLPTLLLCEIRSDLYMCCRLKSTFKGLNYFGTLFLRHF
jgi:hypothetical protein